LEDVTPVQVAAAGPPRAQLDDDQLGRDLLDDVGYIDRALRVGVVGAQKVDQRLVGHHNAYVGAQLVELLEEVGHLFKRVGGFFRPHGRAIRVERLGLVVGTHVLQILLGHVEQVGGDFGRHVDSGNRLDVLGEVHFGNRVELVGATAGAMGVTAGAMGTAAGAMGAAAGAVRVTGAAAVRGAATGALLQMG